MDVQITKHASEQLAFLYRNRLPVSEGDVLRACRAKYEGGAYECIKVAECEFVQIERPGYEFKTVEGDIIVAVVRNGRVTTVLLRKSWSNSDNYRSVK